MPRAQEDLFLRGIIVFVMIAVWRIPGVSGELVVRARRRLAAEMVCEFIFKGPNHTEKDESSTTSALSRESRGRETRNKPWVLKNSTQSVETRGYISEVGC